MQINSKIYIILLLVLLGFKAKAQIVTSFSFSPIVSALDAEVVSGGNPISISGNGKCLQVTGGGIGVFTLGLSEQGVFGYACREIPPMANITVSFSVYPNPTQGACYIKCDGQFDAGLSCQVQLTGMGGKVLQRQVVNMSELQSGYLVNMAGYAAGTYFVTVNMLSRLYSFKLIKL